MTEKINKSKGKSSRIEPSSEDSAKKSSTPPSKTMHNLGFYKLMTKLSNLLNDIYSVLLHFQHFSEKIMKTPKSTLY